MTLLTILSDEPTTRALDGLIESGRDGREHYAQRAAQVLRADALGVREVVRRNSCRHCDEHPVSEERYYNAYLALLTEIQTAAFGPTTRLPRLFGTYLSERERFLAQWGIRVAWNGADLPALDRPNGAGGQDPEPVALPPTPAQSEPDNPETSDPEQTVDATPVASIEAWARTDKGWHWLALDCDSTQDAAAVFASSDLAVDVLELRIITSTDQRPAPL